MREERGEVIAKERERGSEREREQVMLSTDLPEPVCILDALFFRPSAALGNFLKG